MDSNNLIEEFPCPECEGTNSLKIKPKETMAKCELCNKCFFFIKCFQCSYNIYFKKEVFLDGINIVCPYNICGLNISTIICEKCKKKLFLRTKYSQGEKIQCPFCQYQFQKIKCPNLNCKLDINLIDYYEGKRIQCNHISTSNNFSININNSNLSTNSMSFNSSNISINNKKLSPTIFQKVNCYYCSRNMIWDYNKDKIYIESQQIKCPYSECGKLTNKVKCPKCLKNNIFPRGNLEIGSKVVCRSYDCNYKFNIYFCPYCLNSLYGDGTNCEGKEIVCKYCNKIFQFVNCFHCKSVNFWKKNENNHYIEGQVIKCGNCNQNSARIFCPSCRKVNILVKGILVLGKEYNCVYRKCNKIFTISFCSVCNCTYVRLKENKNKICSVCGNKMPCIQCPHCYKFCSSNEPNNIVSYSLCKCPYNDCKKDFYYYICPFCKGDFIKANLKFLNINCPYPNCRKIYTIFQCHKCKKENCILLDNNSMDIEEANCINCNEKNILDNNRTYNSICKIKKIDFKNGEKFTFHNPEVDPYDKDIIDNLIISKIYYINPSQVPKTNFTSNDVTLFPMNSKDNPKNIKCVICLEKDRTSVFAPCGHMCVCLECGKDFMNSNKNEQKRCPLCKGVITDFLEAVIDD